MTIRDSITLFKKKNKSIGISLLNSAFNEIADTVGEYQISDKSNDKDILDCSIRETVRNYARCKDNLIGVYREYIAFLNQMNIRINIDFPPIEISNTFERLMFIAKYLQDQNHKVDDLEDILWVSQRTIEKDMARLYGQEDPIQVCGKPFKIPNVTRARGNVRFESTVHPLFLTENLTQVIAILQGLRSMSRRDDLQGYALDTSIDIWQQLSEYAKNRILFVTSRIFPEDYSWYESLGRNAETNRENGAFSGERYCSDHYNEDVIMESLKSGEGIMMEYENPSGDKVFYKNCIVQIKGYHDEKFDILCDGQMIHIHRDKIIKCGRTRVELY